MMELIGQFSIKINLIKLNLQNVLYKMQCILKYKNNMLKYIYIFLYKIDYK